MEFAGIDADDVVLALDVRVLFTDDAVVPFEGESSTIELITVKLFNTVPLLLTI